MQGPLVTPQNQICTKFSFWYVNALCSIASISAIFALPQRKRIS